MTGALPAALYCNDHVAPMVPTPAAVNGPELASFHEQGFLAIREAVSSDAIGAALEGLQVDELSDLVVWDYHLVPLKNNARLAGTIPLPRHLRRSTRSEMPVDTLGNPRSSCHHVPSCWVWNQSRYSSLGSGSSDVQPTGRPISQDTQSGDREPSTAVWRLSPPSLP